MRRCRTRAAGLAAVLFTAPGVQAAEAVVSATCEVDGKKALIRLDADGAASLQRSGDETYACSLGLGAVEGPPFSDNATGMLTLELSRGECDVKGAQRKVQRNVNLHIADPAEPSKEAMAVVERRAGVFKCAIPKLDMDGLRKLAAPLLGAPR